MMAMLEKQMSNPHIERIDRIKCSLASRSVIAVSIKGGYRTKEDWESYFAMEKANKDGDTGEWALRDAMKDIDSETEAALIDYLPTESGEAAISYIRSYVTTHRSAMQQALPYFVLKKYHSDFLFSMEWNTPQP